MLKSKVSSENYYLHDFGAQTSSNISEHDLIYGFELINNYVQGLVEIISHLVIESKKYKTFGKVPIIILLLLPVVLVEKMLRQFRYLQKLLK